MKHTATTTHKPPFALMLLCSCVFMCLFSSNSVWAQKLPDTAKLVPPETILLVDFDDFGRLRTQFEGTNFYKLYKDPAMAAFVDDFKTKWREKIRKPDNELLRVIADIDALPQGRVAAAFVLNEQINKDANEPPLLLITQWGQTIAKIKEAVDKMVEKAIEPPDGPFTCRDVSFAFDSQGIPYIAFYSECTGSVFVATTWAPAILYRREVDFLAPGRIHSALPLSALTDTERPPSP